MSKTHCKLCNKGINEFLSHLLIDHNIKTVEEYKEKVQIKKEEDRKIAEYQQKVRDLVKMLERKQITAEEYRSKMSKIKM